MRLGQFSFYLEIKLKPLCLERGNLWVKKLNNNHGRLGVLVFPLCLPFVKRITHDLATLS